MSIIPPRRKKRGRQPPPYGQRRCTLCYVKLKLVRLDPMLFRCQNPVCKHEISEHVPDASTT